MWFDSFSLLIQVEAAFHAHGDATNLYASEAPGFHEALFCFVLLALYFNLCAECIYIEL